MGCRGDKRQGEELGGHRRRQSKRLGVPDGGSTGRDNEMLEMRVKFKGTW